MVWEMTEAEEIWRPVVMNLTREEDRNKFLSIRSSKKVWYTHDQIHALLRDLIKARASGRVVDEDEMQQEIGRVLDGLDPSEYGRWIYYPWSGRLVHMLPEREFQELRLDRNRHKLTHREQAKCAALTIGIVGLSVGNAVALTLAMEGMFGHLKLADFDTLDLSNMNRIRAGIHEIGLAKTVLAARQIYELNPYAQITLFHEGITEQNADHFLTSEPRVNVLIDECDSIELKYLLRERARALGIPVIMETSDRGMLDIERFDLEPNRPLFHGLGRADASSVGRTEAVLNITGIDTISTRAAVSMLEIGQTIANWPQLASDVMLGGAAVTAAVRCLALGQPLSSGRRYVDLQDILDGEPEGKKDMPPTPPHDSRSVEVLSAVSEAAAALSAPASGERDRLSTDADASGEGDAAVPELIRFVVEHAILAPSMGNRQPWRFSYSDGLLWVVLVPERADSLLDPSRRASCLALGAAIENIAIAAAYRNHAVLVKPFPLPGNPLAAAALRLLPADPSSLAEQAALFDLLRLRSTNRSSAERRPLTTDQRQQFLRVPLSEHVSLRMVTEDEDIGKAAEIVAAGTRLALLNPLLHQEIITMLRWSPKQADQTRDGIDTRTLQLRGAEKAVLQLLARPDVAAELRELGLGQAIVASVKNQVASTAAIGLVTVENNSLETWLETGRCFQRIWLAAVKMGISVQPIASWIYLFGRLDHHIESIFTSQESTLIGELHSRLKALYQLGSASEPAVLFRLFYGNAPTVKSQRLSIDQVFCSGFPPDGGEER
ncbi:Rv1355c family protein [Brevibacillus humidisoli]|uniref:Rv1355c family protein n=1 Tax=Brevibacillus humidisoli TaxID=2895522 RepID=UPI001E571E4F|nr:Rv1355c family protein [Brevibacillus humidisoli]UFJ41148.1 Rv1355c family protein [Brevibacillus humidisoli]